MFVYNFLIKQMGNQFDQFIWGSLAGGMISTVV